MDSPLKTPRTTHRRNPSRGAHDRALIDAILDEGLVAHVGLSQDGQPFVLPMVFARLGDALFLHGARASRLLGASAKGADLCVTVTVLDGLVLARSAFHHSMNYRAVMIFGRGVEVVDPARKRQAFDALVDRLAPGRSRHARPASDGELAATTVVELALDEASSKVRAGGPKDDAEDRDWPCWAGHVPLRLTPGAPIPAPDLPLQLTREAPSLR